MRTLIPFHIGETVVDVTVPARPGPALPGVRMAGFRGGGPLDLRVVPYPQVTLYIDVGDALLVDEAGERRRPGGCVVGPAPGVVRGCARNADCLQVRLPPGVAHAVLGASCELSGSVVPLQDLWGRGAVEFRERLRDAASGEERFAIAHTALGRRLEAGRAVDPEVAYAWRRMTVSGGRARVEHLADEVGWSRKRLWSRFRAQVGLAPKHAARLVRFDRAVHRLAAGHSAAAVAADGGFVDQSHLSREVKDFTGLTPATVAQALWLKVDDAAWPAAGRGLGRTGTFFQDVRRLDVDAGRRAEH